MDELMTFLSVLVGAITLCAFALGITIMAIRHVRATNTAMEHQISRIEPTISEPLCGIQSEGEANLRVLQIQFATPIELVKHDSRGHDNTELSAIQIYLIRDLFSQYSAGRRLAHRGLVDIYITTSLGEDLLLQVTTQEGVAEALNNIFGLTKSISSYARSIN
jgi:hypothetical protein